MNSEPSPQDVRLINSQRAMNAQAGSFGKKGSVAANGCGSIAAFNALLILGEPVCFEEVRSRFSRHTRRQGRGGASPLYLLYFFIKRGYGIRLYLKKSLKRVRKCHAAYIALYFYSLNKGIGAHYAAAEYDAEADEFIIYNDDAVKMDKKRSSDFPALLRGNGAKYMAVIGIDRKRRPLS